jgi:hypothetical protein
MSTPARTVEPDTTIARASALMLRTGIGALPVVEGERLVGILSLVDCLRAYHAWEAETGRQAAARPGAEDDPDRWVRLPFPPGDRRPGRAGRPRPVPEDAGTAAEVPPTPTRKAG